MMQAAAAVVLAQEEEVPDRGPADWDWDVAWEILPDLARGMRSTVALTLVAMVLAMTTGLVLAILRRSRVRLVRWPVGGFVEVIRSTPLLLQLYFAFLVLPRLEFTLGGGDLGPLSIPHVFHFGPYLLEPFPAAVLALGIHYACYTSESYRAGIESVPRGQWEASTALNFSGVTTWRQVVLPQAIPTVLPALGNYLVASVKDAPLAAWITVTGIMSVANNITSSSFRSTEAYTLAGALFLSVSIPLAMFARYLEKRYGYQRD